MNDAVRVGRRSTSRCSPSSSATVDTVSKLKLTNTVVSHESIRCYGESGGIENRWVDSHFDIPSIERVHLGDFDRVKDAGSNSLSTVKVAWTDIKNIRVCCFDRRSRKRACYQNS